MTDGIITKTCAKCKENLPTSEFYKDKCKRDGLMGKCKACRKSYQKAYREANPEKVAEYQKAYREANPEKVAECKRAWREANPEYQEAWREANPEKIAGYEKAYREANPEVYKAANHRRRARKRNAEGTHSAAQIRARVAVYGDLCIYCASTKDLHIDHIKPLSKGGSNWPANLAPACAKCNLSKQDKWGSDLLRWIKQNCTVERTSRILSTLLG